MLRQAAVMQHTKRIVRGTLLSVLTGGFVSLFAVLGSLPSISSCFLTTLVLPLVSIDDYDRWGMEAVAGCELDALPQGRAEGSEDDAETGVEQPARPDRQRAS